VPLTQKGLDVNVPPAPAQPPQGPPPPSIVLEYAAGGQMTINRQPLRFDELETRLADVFRTRHDKTLFIAADGDLRYGEVVRVIDAAKGVGVARVGVITAGMRERGR
jgi:biopolymer transport protein ExbD